MDFELSQEQKAFFKEVKDFAEKEIAPFTEEYDRNSEFFWDGWKKMGDMGLLGLPFPEEYGGSGGNLADLMVLLEEMGYRGSSGPLFSTLVLGALPILAFGTEEQKRQCLPEIASGDRIMTFALAEREGRWDPGVVRTRVVFQGDTWLVSGTKRFVPDAHLSGPFLCAVRTCRKAKGWDGTSVFLLESQSPGIGVKDMKWAGGDRLFEVRLSRVPVQPVQCVGGIDAGAVVIRDTLQKAAVGKCAEMIGGARAVLDMALAYARERVQFGRPIGSFQAVQHHLADMWTDIHGSRSLYRRAALCLDRGWAAACEVSMAKARTGAACRRVTTLGHQIFGAVGFTREHDMHRYHRQALAGDMMYGNGSFHRDRVAEEMGL